jgi:serine/threonine protein phosphatase PrpC
MHAVLAGCAPQEACERLIALAREHGAPDNVSVALIAVPPINAGMREQSSSVRETRVVDIIAAPAADAPQHSMDGDRA